MGRRKLDHSVAAKDFIREHHKRGWKMQQIADGLNATGIKTPQGKPWIAPNVSRIAVQELGLRRTKEYAKTKNSRSKASKEVTQDPWVCLLDIMSSNLSDENKKFLAKSVVKNL
jgi:hypothetical protein